MSTIDNILGNRPDEMPDERPLVEAGRAPPRRRPPSAIGVADNPPASPIGMEPSREWYAVSFWKANEAMVLQHGTLSAAGVPINVDATLVMRLKPVFFGLLYEMQAFDFVGRVDEPLEGNMVKRHMGIRSFGRFRFADDTYRQGVRQYLGGMASYQKENFFNVNHVSFIMRPPQLLMNLLKG